MFKEAEVREWWRGCWSRTWGSSLSIAYVRI